MKIAFRLISFLLFTVCHLLVFADLLIQPSVEYPHSARVSAVAVSPTSQRIAAGAANGEIRIWDRSSGNLQQTLQGPPSIVRSVKFSGDGKYLLAGFWDCDHAVVWNLEAETQRSFAVTDTHFAKGFLIPNSTTIILAQENGEVLYYNYLTGQSNGNIAYPSHMQDYALIPNGTVLMGIDTSRHEVDDGVDYDQGRIVRYVLNVTPRKTQLLSDLQNYRYQSIDASPDNNNILYARRSLTIRETCVADKHDGNLIQIYPMAGQVRYVTAEQFLLSPIYPLSSFIPSSSAHDVNFYFGDLPHLNQTENYVRKITISNQTVSRTYADVASNDMAVSPDGNWIITGGPEPLARCWPVSDSPVLPSYAWPPNGLLFRYNASFYDPRDTMRVGWSAIYPTGNVRLSIWRGTDWVRDLAEVPLTEAYVDWDTHGLPNSLGGDPPYSLRLENPLNLQQFTISEPFMLDHEFPHDSILRVMIPVKDQIISGNTPLSVRWSEHPNTDTLNIDLYKDRQFVKSIGLHLPVAQGEFSSLLSVPAGKYQIRLMSDQNPSIMDTSAAFLVTTSNAAKPEGWMAFE